MRKYFTTFRVSITNAFMYRGNMLSGWATYCMFILVFFCLWRTIYSAGDMPGFTLTQIIWYLCITEIVSYGTRSQIYQTVSNEVKDGSIAYQLLRPYGYAGYRFAEAMGPMVMNTLIFGIVGCILGFVVVGPIEGYQLWTLIPGILSLMLGIILYFFIQFSIGLSSFFIEDPYGINLIVSKCIMMFGTFIPVEFLPKGIQGIVKCLPFSYTSWAPARLLVAFDKDLFIHATAIQLAYLGFFIILSTVLMFAGRRALQANGG